MSPETTAVTAKARSIVWTNVFACCDELRHRWKGNPPQGTEKDQGDLENPKGDAPDTERGNTCQDCNRSIRAQVTKPVHDPHGLELHSEPEKGLYPWPRQGREHPRRWKHGQQYRGAYQRADDSRTRQAPHAPTRADESYRQRVVPDRLDEVGKCERLVSQLPLQDDHTRCANGRQRKSKHHDCRHLAQLAEEPEHHRNDRESQRGTDPELETEKGAEVSSLRRFDASYQADTDSSVREKLPKRDEDRSDSNDSKVIRRQQSRQHESADERDEPNAESAQQVDCGASHRALPDLLNTHFLMGGGWSTTLRLARLCRSVDLRRGRLHLGRGGAGGQGARFITASEVSVVPRFVRVIAVFRHDGRSRLRTRGTRHNPRSAPIAIDVYRWDEIARVSCTHLAVGSCSCNLRAHARRLQAAGNRPGFRWRRRASALLARRRHADRARRRDRRLNRFACAEEFMSFVGLVPLGALLRRASPAGLDHQDRQRARTPATRRGGPARGATAAGR